MEKLINFKKGKILLVAISIICICFLPTVLGNDIRLINKDISSSNENSPPLISNPIPGNGEIVDLNIDELSVFIEDPDGDRFDWTIETSPNIGSNYGDLETYGSKFCSISDLIFSETYTWYVNATDGENWSNKSYSFTTGDEPSYIPTIANIIINVKEFPGKTKLFIGIENNYNDITQWNTKNNKIRITWEIQNKQGLEYNGNDLNIKIRTREFQEESILPQFLFFTETGRIDTPGYKWNLINIPITKNSSNGEAILDVKLTELDDMLMVTFMYYFNMYAEPSFMPRASGNNIIIP